MAVPLPRPPEPSSLPPDPPPDPSLAQATAALRREVASNRGWFIALGVVLALAGAAAIVFPLVSTISASILVGWLLTAAGIVQVVHAFSVRDWSGWAWSILVGLVYVVAGLLTAFNPLVGALSLTVLLAVAFLVEGVVEIAWSLRVRNEPGWGWVMLSGVVAILAGTMIGLALPSSALWAIGLLVGVNLLLSGGTFLFLAASVPDSATRPPVAGASTS